MSFYDIDVFITNNLFFIPVLFCNLRLLQPQNGKFNFIFIHELYIFLCVDPDYVKFFREMWWCQAMGGDSPVKCAKFCTHRLMQTTKNTIIHREMIEVQNKSLNTE